MAVSEAKITQGVVDFFSKKPKNNPTEVVEPATLRIYTFSQIPWEEFAQATGGDLSHHFSGSVLELRKQHAFIYLDRDGSPDSFLGYSRAGEKNVFKIDGAIAVIGESCVVLLQPPKTELKKASGGLEATRVSKGVLIPKEGEIQDLNLEINPVRNNLTKDILSVVAARAKEIEAIYR